MKKEFCLVLADRIQEFSQIPLKMIDFISHIDTRVW